MLEATASEDFKKKLLSAAGVAAGGPKTFGLESYDRKRLTGYEASREYRFWPLSKFQQHFEATPSQLCAPVETIQDEMGKDAQGVLMRPAEDAELKVRVFRMAFGDLAEHLSMASSQLREGQATDLAKMYEDDLRKVMPAAMSKPSSVLSLPELEEKQRQWKLAKERKLEEQAALQAALPPPPQPANTDQKDVAQTKIEEGNLDDDDDDDDEDETPDGPGIQLPSASVAGKGKSKGKNKGKQKNKSKGKGKGGVAAVVQRAAGSAATSSTSIMPSLNVLPSGDEGSRPSEEEQTEQRSVAGSQASGSRWGGLRRLTPRSKLFAKAEHWRSVIKVERVLEEGSFGRAIWQAGQTMSALERTNPGEVPVVLLRELLTLCKAAQDCQSCCAT